MVHDNKPYHAEGFMEAILSECGKYRYVLKRKTKTPLRWVKPCLFIMLNPSVADDKIDDPTIRKCIHYAERERCTGLTVVNLFALRATDPKELNTWDKRQDEFKNYHHIMEQLDKHKLGLVVLAWGSNKNVGTREVEPLLFQMRQRGITPMCLAVNQDGNPRHPLYVPKDQPLIEYTR